MKVKFEASELEGSTFLGEGDHLCTITRVEHKDSRKGDPMIEVDFTAINGKSTRDWFMLAGNKFKLGGLSVACGFSKEALASSGLETADLYGKRVRVIREVKGKETYETRDGETKERNRYENSYLPPEGGSVASNEEIPF